MNQKIALTIAQLVLLAGMGLLLLFMIAPYKAVGLFLNPVNKKAAASFLSHLASGSFEQAAESIGQSRKQEWVAGMEQLKREGFYAVGYDDLDVPHDPEHGDGRANIVFIQDGERQTYYAVMTFRPGAVQQVCLFFGKTSRHTEAWNKLNCHY